MSSAFLPSFYAPTGSSDPKLLLAACTVLPVLGIFAVALRFNLRKEQKTSLRPDDWFMIPALLFVIGMGICGILGYENRVWGFLTADNDNPDSTAFEGKLLFAFIFIQIAALACIKLGALFFYHRVFVVQSHRARFDIVLYASMGVIVLWTIAMFILQALQCGSHPSALWTGYDVYDIYCGSAPAIGTALPATNVILDFWVILLPIPKVFLLNMKTSRKFAVGGVFLLAIIGLAASIARLVSWVAIEVYVWDTSTDYRLEDTVQVYWSVIEAGIALIAVNLPSIWAYNGKLSPEGILRSVRSVFSLHSLRGSTDRSRDLNRQSALIIANSDANSLPSSSSQAAVDSKSEAQSNDTHDIEAQRDIPEKSIMVTSTLHQSVH